MKKIFIFILTTAIGTISFAEQKVYKIKWVLAHEPARVFEKAAKEFAKRIDAKTNGQIQVNVIDAKTFNQNSNDSKVVVDANKAFSLVQSGELQMSQTYSTYLGNHNKQMWILDLPFLFKSHQHASKVLDGEIGKKILAGLEPSNVKGLAFTYSGGYRIIPSQNKPLSTMAAFKDENIGVAKDSPIAQAYLKDLGATPVPVADASGQNEVANGGFETTYARLSNIKDIKSKYLNETEHSLFLTSIIINKPFFDSLPQDLQNAIQETSLEIAQLEREDSVKDGIEAKKEMVEKNNMTVIKMSPAEKKKMIKASGKVYETYSKLLDKNIIAAIQNTK